MKTSQALPWSAQGEKEGICDSHTVGARDSPGVLTTPNVCEKALPRLTLGKENTVTRENRLSMYTWSPSKIQCLLRRGATQTF